MAISKGTAKVVAYKKETTWGTAAGTSGGKQVRRVTADFNLTKETYESNEIRTDRQLADFRHGVRSADGTLSGELSPNSYSDFMQSLVAKDFAAVTAVTGISATIAAGSGTLWTVTRAAGDWLSNGLKVGSVIRLTGAGLDTANVAKNLLIVSMTSSAITVQVLNGSALVAEGPIASVTATVVGKQTFVPATGHTEDSYTIEQWFQDIAQSEVFTGMRVGSMNLQLPATGLTTVDFSFMGKDLSSKGTTQYFGSPTAQGTNGIFAAVNGAMIVNGLPVALVTSADFTVERAMENATAVGSNSVAEIFLGRIRVTGNLSVYFQDATFRNYFDDETSVSIVFALTTGSEANADFLTFTLPKVKLGSFAKDDGELGLVASTSFQALLNADTSAGLPATTVQIQDSTLV
jgi:hypothetical protein